MNKNLHTQLHLTKRTHRKFTIITQNDHNTILEDTITRSTYPYKKLNIPIEEIVILYIKDLDPYTGRANFQYSVLNDYKEGEEYEFDVIEKHDRGFSIENIEDFSLFIPLSFEKLINDNKIKLTVEKIDIESNRLFYKTPETHSTNSTFYDNTQLPAELFDVGKKYVFKIEGFETISEDISVLKLEFNGFKCTVKAFDFQNKDNLQKNITCFVKQILGRNIYLLQDRFSTFKELFKEGENYDFTIINKEADNNSIEYYRLKDEFGFYHKLYPNDFLEEELSEDDFNTVRSFHLRKINEQGFLTIYLNTEKVHGKFYTVEYVFDQAGVTNSIYKLFYNLRNELSDDKYSRYPFINLFEDYDNKENLWFFSYLSFLQKYIQHFKYNEDYKKSLELTEIYVKLEEWMLEGSHFLALFSNDKKIAIIHKAENQLSRSSYQIDALKIIIEGKSEDFIQEILNKLRRSGYLRNDSVNIFKSILFTSQDIIYKSTEDIIEIVLLLIENDRLDDYDKVNFMSVLEGKNKNEKQELNSSLLFKSNKLDDEDRKKIQNIIKIQALLINFNKQGIKKTNEVINSANFYHYLSLLTDDIVQKKNLLESAIEAIAKNKVIEVTLKQIRDLNINSFITKKKDKIENDSIFEAKYIYSNKGALYNHKNGMAFLSSNQYFYLQNQDTVLLKNLGNFNTIIIGTPLNSSNYKLSNLSSPNEYKVNWEKYYSAVNKEEFINKRISNKKIPETGTIVDIVTKNYLKDNSDLIFAKIESEEYEGEGILHIQNVSRVKFEGLHGILWPGKRLQAKVIESSKKGLSFSIIDNVWNKMKYVAKIGDIVNAKIVDIKEQYNIAFLITENGYFGQTPLGNLNKDASKGNIFKFKINEVLDKHKYFALEYISESDIQFNEKEAFKAFLKECILTKSLNIDSKRNDVSSELYKHQINDLIVILTEYNHLQIDILKKIEYNYLLKLLSSLLKSSKSYYFDAQINYLSTVYYLKETKYNESVSDLIMVPDDTLSIYKKLETFNDKYEILGMLNKNENIDDLARMIEKEQSDDTSKLSKLVLAHNILASEKPDDEVLLTHTKNMIYENLSKEKIDILQIVPDTEEQEFEEENEIADVVVNLGKEGKFREFKTSFIYYAGTNSLNIEEQSFVILRTIAGFLNAKGGSLFMGVNDNGDISGLNEEYLHLGDNGNSDKYERFIRKRIVDSFNKDINSQIEFKFMFSENNEYLEIVIPEYEKPVPLDNEFFQRQGNETRILKGNDLVMFFERKMRNVDISNKKIKNAVKHKDNDLINLNGTQKDLKLFGEQDTDTIELLPTEKLMGSNVLAYLYFFNNGTYMLSEQVHTNKNIKHGLTITNENKKGFLLQGYDNGCVNKVDVRTLLGKRFGYNYNNGFSREGNLILLDIINEEALIQINSIRNNIEYIKVFDTKNISIHNMLHLKGNNIIQTKYDKLLSMKTIKSSFKNQLSRVIYNSKQTIGKSINSYSYRDEFSLLKNLD